MDFIEIKMFLTLAGCLTIVAMMVQVLKQFIKINPHILNIACSTLIGVIRIFVINDLSWQGILTGVLNIFVIYPSRGLAMFVGARWMDDIIDNNARRQDYHPFKDAFEEEKEY